MSGFNKGEAAMLGLLGGLFGGGGGGLLGGLASGILGLFGAKKKANEQAKNAQAEQAAITASEAKAQAAYRDKLRSGAVGRGSGSFRIGEVHTQFRPSLKSLTGQ